MAHAYVVSDKLLELVFDRVEGVGVNFQHILRIALVDLGHIIPSQANKNESLSMQTTHFLLRHSSRTTKEINSLKGVALAWHKFSGDMSSWNVPLWGRLDACHVMRAPHNGGFCTGFSKILL